MENELVPIDRDLAIVEKLSAFAKLAQAMPQHANKKPGEILMVLMKGRDMGLSPIESLEGLYLVNGRPTLSADARNRMIRKHGHRVEIVEWTSKVCRLRGIRKGETKGEEVSYGIEEAALAGLTGKDNWKKHAKEMLFARCISLLQRVHFPDVLTSVVYDPDEAEQIPQEPSMTVEVVPEEMLSEEQVKEITELAEEFPKARDNLLSRYKSFDKIPMKDVENVVKYLQALKAKKEEESGLTEHTDRISAQSLDA